LLIIESRTKKSEDATLLRKLEDSFITGAIFGMGMLPWVAMYFIVVQRKLNVSPIIILMSYCVFSCRCNRSNTDNAADNADDYDDDVMIKQQKMVCISGRRVDIEMPWWYKESHRRRDHPYFRMHLHTLNS
jgi:hypothetical protein